MRPDLSLLRRLPALRRHVAVCAAAAVATAVAVVVQANAVAAGLSRLVAGDQRAVAPLVVALTVVGAVRALARWATERSATRAIQLTRRSVADGVVHRLDALDDAGWSATAPSAAAAMCTTGVDALEPWIRSYLPALCLAAVVPLAAGARILAADVLSAVILLLTIPLIPVFMVLIGRMTAERSQRQWATLQRLGSHFHDVLVGLETLRLFGRAEVQVARVREITDHYRQAVMRTLRVAFLSALVLELLATLSVALVAVSAGVRLAEGHIGLRTALVVLLLAPECSLPLRRVGAAFHAAAAGSDAATDLDGFDELTTTPDGSHGGRPVGTIEVSGLVVIDEVRGHRVGPVDLRVAPGEVVALCGPTGSGKSTVLAAIAGTVPATAGQILLGGRDVAEWSRDARRAAVMVVPQHPLPLGRSVLDSVAVGNRSASERARMAQLEALDLGALAHHRPEELSGGERQRLAVARAVLAVEGRGATVLLVDEPTAHLDPRRAELVVGRLRDAAEAGAAVVVVTHDRDVAARADRVINVIRSTVAEPSPRLDRPMNTGVEGRPLETAVVPTASPSTWVVPGAAPSHGLADLRWLSRVAPTQRGRLAGARALGVAAEACTVGLAVSAAWLILRAAQHPTFAALTLVAVAVRAFGIGKGFLRYSERLASHDATFRQLADIRAVVVERLGRIVPAGLPRTGHGDLLAAVVDDVDRLADLELRVIGPALSAFLVASALVIGLVFIAPVAAAIMVGAVIVAGVVLPALVGLRAVSTSGPLVEAKAEVADGVVELAERAAEIASLGATSEWGDPITTSAARVAELDGVRGRRAALASGAMAGMPAWVAAAMVGALGAATASMSGRVVGVAVLIPFAVMELFVPAVTGAELASTVSASAGRLRRLLEHPDPTPEPAVPAAPGPTTHVELDDLSVGWPDGPTVLSEFDLELVPSSRLAICGPSGSGKSTLAAALVGFLLPRQGRYRLGEIDTTTLGGQAIRRTVTWCTQDPWLANTSIRENLLIAEPQAEDDKLWRALDLVRLTPWVEALPSGLDTLLGRDAVTASGGQRQRLAIARVLLSHHQVVILDEPTAHLDADTATAVLDDLLDALEGRSIVLLGHAADQFDVAPTLDLSPRTFAASDTR